MQPREVRKISVITHCYTPTPRREQQTQQRRRIPLHSTIPTTVRETLTSQKHKKRKEKKSDASS
jgi:hypothetical protein